MKTLLYFFLLFFVSLSFSQSGLLQPKSTFTRQDSLRGAITPEREWWDLLKYNLYVKVDPDQKSIEGRNTITYRVIDPGSSMQIDLQPPLEITGVTQKGNSLDYEREGNVYFINTEELETGREGKITITYEGVPVEAKRPPWDGGFTWSKDGNGNHFIATSNQGLGASVWWPCKDHMYDEPDRGMTMSYNVPGELIAVGNGRLIKKKKEKDGTRTFTWEVVNPINNYGVNLNAADYVNWNDTYDGEKGKLDLSFWVLRENKEKAKDHFQDVYRTLEAFEYWFGPYPFYEDSYKLVEVPYLGMEHQSSVTYGNKYMNGYLGRDLSGTGQGLKWDYIIIHESGHEWFANNITYIDIADMWIHEGFTSYSESLFVEYHYGKEAASEYTRGLRWGIENVETIIGPYGVNKEGHPDMYPKGHNMLHTIRQIVNDDEKWRNILRGLNQDFYHQTVSTEDIENYISEKSGIDLSKVFDQYLRNTEIPTLVYRINRQGVLYKWINCVEGFDMPVKVQIDDEEVWLKPTTEYNALQKAGVENFTIDPDFYVGYLNMMGE